MFSGGSLASIRFFRSQKEGVLTMSQALRAISLAVMFSLGAGIAIAQETPPPNAVVLETSVPKMSCPQPKVPQRVSVAPEDVAYLEKQAQAYGDCVTKYVNDRQAQTQKYNDMAKAEAEAGNAAVIEINSFYAQVKDIEKKNKPKGDSYDAGN
jgi:hypothetical protein